MNKNTDGKTHIGEQWLASTNYQFILSSMDRLTRRYGCWAYASSLLGKFDHYTTYALNEKFSDNFAGFLEVEFGRPSEMSVAGVMNMTNVYQIGLATFDVNMDTLPIQFTTLSGALDLRHVKSKVVIEAIGNEVSKNIQFLAEEAIGYFEKSLKKELESIMTDAFALHFKHEPDERYIADDVLKLHLLDGLNYAAKRVHELIPIAFLDGTEILEQSRC